TRRAFLRRAGAVAATSGSAGYLALAPPSWPGSLQDPTGERGKPSVFSRSLPDGGFGVQASKTLPYLGVARGDDLRAMVRAAVDSIGGISRFVRRGDTVVIKPNVAFGRAAPLGATSNPEVVKELVALVREAGAREIRVADNPIESPEDCFARSGIRKAALEAGARVYLPAPQDFEILSVPGAKWISRWPFFWRPFRGADKVIGVAPVKDHNLCHASMTTKNWYGLLGGRRNQFHQDIHGIITDLSRMMRPTFVLLDGSRVMFKSGPTGGSLSDVRPGQTIVASTDTLTADAFGWDDLLGRDPHQRPAYLHSAATLGLGQPDWKSLHVKEVQVG
ncbi:MAG: DUF362 domain-containing protein, partial [Myxococcales bacterium]|nr:DUF362 domain-containing protein [Myxococcales bacterium]